MVGGGQSQAPTRADAGERKHVPRVVLSYRASTFGLGSLSPRLAWRCLHQHHRGIVTFLAHPTPSSQLAECRILTASSQLICAMARLNTRTSATPLSRAGTVDSLYRDPTPASRLDGASAARQSSYSVLSPSASQNSDKENNEPSSRGVTPRPMGKAPAMSNKRLQRPATPDSGSSNKRRRTGDYTSTIEADSVSVFEDEDLDLKKNSEDEGDDVEQSQAPPTPDDDDDARFYDPDQNPEERRMVSALLRDHHREVLG